MKQIYLVLFLALLVDCLCHKSQSESELNTQIKSLVKSSSLSESEMNNLIKMGSHSKNKWGIFRRIRRLFRWRRRRRRPWRRIRRRVVRRRRRIRKVVRRIRRIFHHRRRHRRRRIRRIVRKIKSRHVRKRVKRFVRKIYRKRKTLRRKLRKKNRRSNKRRRNQSKTKGWYKIPVMGRHPSKKKKNKKRKSRRLPKVRRGLKLNKKSTQYIEREIRRLFSSKFNLKNIDKSIRKKLVRRTLRPRVISLRYIRNKAYEILVNYNSVQGAKRASVFGTKKYFIMYNLQAKKGKRWVADSVADKYLNPFTQVGRYRMKVDWRYFDCRGIRIDKYKHLRVSFTPAGNDPFKRKGTITLVFYDSNYLGVYRKMRSYCLNRHRVINGFIKSWIRYGTRLAFEKANYGRTNRMQRAIDRLRKLIKYNSVKIIKSKNDISKLDNQVSKTKISLARAQRKFSRMLAKKDPQVQAIKTRYESLRNRLNLFESKVTSCMGRIPICNGKISSIRSSIRKTFKKLSRQNILYKKAVGSIASAQAIFNKFTYSLQRCEQKKVLKRSKIKRKKEAMKACETNNVSKEMRRLVKIEYNNLRIQYNLIVSKCRKLFRNKISARVSITKREKIRANVKKTIYRIRREIKRLNSIVKKQTHICNVERVKCERTRRTRDSYEKRVNILKNQVCVKGNSKAARALAPRRRGPDINTRLNILLNKLTKLNTYKSFKTNNINRLISMNNKYKIQMAKKSVKRSFASRRSRNFLRLKTIFIRLNNMIGSVKGTKKLLNEVYDLSAYKVIKKTHFWIKKLRSLVR